MVEMNIAGKICLQVYEHKNKTTLHIFKLNF